MSNKLNLIPKLPKGILNLVMLSDNYFILNVNQIIEQLNGLSSRLPRRYGWRFRSVEAYRAELEAIDNSAIDALPANLLYWKDTLANCEAYSLMNVWRTIELARSCSWALARHDAICASLLARSALETAAQFVDFARTVAATLGL